MRDNKKRKRRGFTLIELVVVIAILGILVAIAVPRLGGSRATAAINAHNANVRTLESAAMMYIADNGNPTGTVTWDEDTNKDTNGTTVGYGTGWGNYLQEWPEVPSGTGYTNVEGKTYKVTINTAGAVTVTPAKIDQ